jgi:nucleoside-diphosphate-sugar epimerase
MVRDYCFVKDIARANLLAAKTHKQGTYNIGTGRGTTTRLLYTEIVQALRQSGVDLSPLFDRPTEADAREGDIKVSTLDTSKTQAELGFQATFQLRDGLAQTVDWYLSRQETQA